MLVMATAAILRLRLRTRLLVLLWLRASLTMLLRVPLSLMVELRSCPLRMIRRRMSCWSITAAATVMEAMLTPPMAIAPTGPRPYAEENTVIEVSGPVKPAWCAGIGSIVIVTIGTGRLDAQINDELSLGSQRQRDRCKHRCRTK